MRVTALTPQIGATVADVDISNLSEQQWQDIRALFAKHLVLVFRDQTIDREAHKAFGRRLGNLHLHPAKVHLGVPGDPEIFDINISEKTKVANGEAWHSDLSCELIPPLASALYITAPPASGGGDTMFANMYQNFESLSGPVRDLLLRLTAFHDGRKDLAGYGYQLKPGETYPSASHPVVALHPVTRRPALFVNEPFTVRINELSRRESDALLTILHRHVETNLRFQCRVQWQPNTLVLWDNRAAQHHAIWDYYPEPRLGERVTVQGAAPPQAAPRS